MRTTAFAIALLISGAAMAQTTETTVTEVPDVDVGVQPDGDLDVDVDTKTKVTTTTVDGTTSTTTIDDDEATETVATTTTTLASMTPASGAVVAPSNADPEHDARGIAVISDAAAVPAGFNGVTGTAVGGPLVDPATGATVDTTATSYPACTATITDNCVQTYERQGR